MSRPRLSVAVSALLLAIAACTDRTGEPTGPQATAVSAARASDRAGPEPFDGSDSHARVGALRTSDAENGQAKNGSFRTAGTGIYYHGGPVLQAGTKVVAVYWASAPIYSGGPAAGTTGAGSADGSLVGYFLNNLGGSPYFNINTSYTDGSGNKIVNSVSYTGYWANNVNVPSNGQSVSEAQMLAMLQSGINSGAITYDPGTSYAIFTAGTVNLGGGFGTQYCAYHWYGTVTVGGVSKNILYAAMPYDYAYPSACTNGSKSPNGDPAADAEANVLAHEIEETTTDVFGTAWYDRRGYENADKCAWTFGSTYTTSNGGTANMLLGSKNFLIQQNWVNAGNGGCVLKF